MKFSDIETAVTWIESEKSTVLRAAVQKVTAALEYLGNPHKNLPVIHITGTNGKGSSTAFLRDLLQSQGLRVGTFTSPHIMRFNERIGYNGEYISDEDLLSLINQIYELNEYMATTEYGRLVYFEIYTVMMALYFAQKQPDVCLIEVGIGGYSDSTVVFDGQIAVITTIGLDHGDKLGNTVEEVAYEKSGIIKKNAHVVTGDIQASCLEIIQKKIDESSAIGHRFGRDYQFNQVENLKDKGSTFTWSNEKEAGLSVHIDMVGRHQVHNASVALEVFSLWMNEIIHQEIDWASAIQAIAHTKWLARMEKIHQDPLIYIDGAHNVAGLAALNNMMEEYFSDYQYTILYAGLSTKNQEEQLPFLLKFNSAATYLTEFEHAKAMTAEDFENMAIPSEDLPEIVNWQDFIRDYIHSPHSDNELLLVTGSLYFASDVREFILNPL